MKNVNFIRAMQTLYELSPAGFTQAFSEKHAKPFQSKEAINQADFLRMISKNFIDSVGIISGFNIW